MVDASATDRTLYRTWLEQGYGSALEFLEATSGKQAIAMCLSTVMDCVLLTHKSPKIHGLDFISALPAGVFSGAARGSGSRGAHQFRK